MYIPTALLTQAGGDFSRIFDSTLGADAASFDITGISSGFKHLELIANLRGTTAATQIEVQCRFNNDSGANYDAQFFFILGAGSTGVTSAVAATAAQIGLITAGTATANHSGTLRILVSDYANTTFFKKIEARTSYSRATGVSNDQINTIGVGTWNSTSAINRITIFPTAGNWLAGSRLTLYGIN